MKYLVLIMTLLIMVSLITSVTAKEHQHHQRIGYHGMVMFTDGQNLYTSHLPLYQKPHDYQLIYRVESQFKSQLIKRLNNNQMITILPDKFDLNRLITGERFAISTQLFAGHFERGGKKWRDDHQFEFKQSVYQRRISQLSQKSMKHFWKQLPTITTEQKLYVYQIQTAPSFDSIVLAQNCTFNTNTSHQSKVLTKTQIQHYFSQCKNHKVLYFETQDFSKR